MTISAPNFTRLQTGVPNADDLRVRGPVNVALAYLGGSLITQLNNQFNAISQSNSVQIAAQLAAFPITSGLHTPTLTNVTNLSASTAYQAQYLRVGSIVFLSGRVDVDPVALASTELGISLPVASNFANIEQCSGTAGPTAGGIQETGAIVGDVTNDRAALFFLAASTANHGLTYHFMYRVI